MKVIRYNISNRSEECQCPVCGFKLFVDDHAYQIAPDGEAGFCSGSCAKDHTSRLARAATLETAEAEADADLERTLRGLARDLVALGKIRAGETV